MLAGGRSGLKCGLTLLLVAIFSGAAVVDSNPGFRNETEPWEHFWSRNDIDTNDFIEGRFDDEFLWGAGSSAYQTEGAWKKYGKGLSVWDKFAQTPGKIPVSKFMQMNHVQESIVDDNSSLSTGNVATDSYFKAPYDAQLLAGLGAPNYRFSLSWSRIFPGGNPDGKEQANQMAVDHYNDVINELLARGITPVVTLYHFDLPLALDELGGWLNSKSRSWFELYADFCFGTFGDRVKDWVTIYDPYTVAWKGYGCGKHPPGFDSPASDTYISGKNLLLAHASAWQTYNNQHRASQAGRVSIALSSDWYEPANAGSQQDVEAAIRASEFRLGFFANPIFLKGDFPQIMKDQVAAKLAPEASTLPTLSPDEINLIKGSADYFILIPGTAHLVTYQDNSAILPQDYWTHQDIALSKDPTWHQIGIGPAQAPVSWSIRRLLYLVHGRYVMPSSSPTAMTSSIVVYDPGFATDDVTQLIDDWDRKEYYKSYLNEMLKAKYRESVPVGGFFAQLLDSFEWEHGFTRRAGLHYVDFNNPDRPRTAKSSATFYQGVASKNGFPTPEADKILYGTFPPGFMWGVSSAAYSIEGGYRAKANDSIWDQWTHDAGSDNADVSANQYEMWANDVTLLNYLGVTHYRVSISWSRFLSATGKQYYLDFFTELKRNNIKVIADLYHHDLPAGLFASGWADSGIVAEFESYARDCFNLLATVVDIWITIAAPYEEVINGYKGSTWPPGLNHTQMGLDAAHNMLLAHSAVWTLYDTNYRSTNQGQVGFSLLANWAEPNNPSIQEEYDSRELFLNDVIGWFANPLVYGDYPQSMRDRLGTSLPTFGVDITGKYDFFGVDHYTTFLVNSQETRQDITWLQTPDPDIKPNPSGLRKVLKWISQTYGQDKGLFVAASGIPDWSNAPIEGNTIITDYRRRYVNEALKAHLLDGVNLQGFVERSFLDGFEWEVAYAARYGLYHVDFASPYLNRTITTFGEQYRQIVADNGFVSNQPPTNSMTSAALPASDVTASSESSFVALEASAIPSAASVSVWKEFNAVRYDERDRFYYGTFPQDFGWSVSSSAYEIEGAWNEDGKGESIWDRFSHTSNKIYKNQTGDISADSYHKTSENVNLIKMLGVSHYRFSIAWTRIFPDGTNTNINQAGIDYYNQLINSLIDKGIEPIVTLYYWDLPQALQDVGGFQNESIVQHFLEYANFCFNTFGDRVKMWNTFNDPYTICWIGYGLGVFAPGVSDQPGTAPYLCAHNIIKAHAKAYRLYQREYMVLQSGKVGITLNSNWAEPKDPKSEICIRAADRMLQSCLGWFAHPIFKNGDYPEVVKQQVADKSALQGLPKSRLPIFTELEKLEIGGSYDFFGLTSYTSRRVNHQLKDSSTPNYENDRDTNEVPIPRTTSAYPPWQQVVPWGLRRFLNWVDREYGSPPIYIIENGVGSSDPTVDDENRLNFFKTNINEALKAHSLDGVDVRGYSVMSLLDGFEWNVGYSAKFGLFHVDFSDPARPRTPRRSSICYNQVIRNNGFPPLKRDERLIGEFPKDFIWAVATSSYQIEGAWRSDGKAVGIWDKTSHTPGLVADGLSGDVACDSYNKIDVDVELLKNLGVSHYRFSLSWPRLIPTGNASDGINPAAVDYYNRLIDALLAANIKPMVTLYHWDLPLVFQDTFGGWPNSQIIDLFVDYADACYNAFGSKVKKWITFNEPWVFTVLGYSVAVHSPNLRDSGRSDYQAGHNILLAHAKAYRLYHEKYAAEQQGEVAITCNCDWHEARNMYRETDHDASERIMQFYLGWWVHPIWVNGDYPDVMKDFIDARSAAQGEPVSRLPKFTEEEKNLIRGSSDFFGLNHYTTNLGFDTFHPSSINSVGYFQDQEAGTSKDPTWPAAASPWLKNVPWGVRRLLSWIKDQCGDPAILITENGFSEEGSSVELNDYWRKDFYHGYINEVLKAIKLDGVNVTGYTAWSLMDNFEWNAGYTERFGLHWVNFSDPERPRIPKQSTLCLKEIMTKSYPAEGLPACMGSGNVTTNTDKDLTKKTNFLGLSLDREDSQTALYILFATSVAFFATTSMAVFLWSPLMG